MNKPDILVIEDEEDLQQLITYNLQRSGFDVASALSGEDGLRQAAAHPPDLILLDLMLPGLDGLDVCRALKRQPDTQHIPVIMVTAKGEETDVVLGLELGADDYLVKPFSPRVLIARIKAVLRRRHQPQLSQQDSLQFGDLLIHPGRHQVTLAGQDIPLTFTEFGILHLLARRPGWVFTRNQIVESVLGQDVTVTDRTIDVHVAALRKKLGPAGDLVQTVRSVGYRLKDL